MEPDEPNLDGWAAEVAVVDVYRQIVSVLGRGARSVITDPVMFDVAETLFAAFADAGERGLTVEQMHAACRRYPRAVAEERVRVLRELKAIRPAFEKPNAREFQASFTAYVSLLFVQRMLRTGGQAELHQLLAIERINLESRDATDVDARRVAAEITRAFRLLANELVGLAVGGTIESLRERAPLLWSADELITRATGVHGQILERWPSMGRACMEMRAGVDAYRDASQSASARLADDAGATRALDLLPVEMWNSFAQRATVRQLADVLATHVFDAPAAWHDAVALDEALANTAKPVPTRIPPPRPALPDRQAGEGAVRVDADLERLRALAEDLLSGRDAVSIPEVLREVGDWTTARRVFADLTAASNSPELAYRIDWEDTVELSGAGAAHWMTHGWFRRAEAAA